MLGRTIQRRVQSGAVFRGLASIAGSVRHRIGRAHGTIGWVLVVLALTAPFSRLVIDIVHRSRDPLTFADDVRSQVFPFYSLSGPSLYRADYIAAYHRECLPLGYSALYTLGALVSDAALLSKVLPFFLLAAALVGLAVASSKLGGKIAAFAAIAWALGASLLMDRIGGGLPRAFGFPIIALAIAALAVGRVRLLAVLVCLGAAFYPVCAVILGLTMAVLLLVVPAKDRGEAADWTLRRRLLWLLGAALGCVVLLLPPAIGTIAYGPAVGPADVARFPEAGPGGRYGPDDHFPVPKLAAQLRRYVPAAILGAGEPWVSGVPRLPSSGTARGIWAVVLFEFIGLGWIGLFKAHAGARRILVIIPGGAAGYVASRVLAPYFYIPQRYILFTAGALVPVLAGTAVFGYLGMLRGLPASMRSVLAVSVTLLLLLVYSGRGLPDRGLNMRVPGQELPLLRRLAALPAGVLIAGWPTGAIDDVPYVSRRSVLVSFETHQAFHQRYLLEMRRRMTALIDAYFASTSAPLLRLRDEFGVTHLVVDRRLYYRPPRYFQPFPAEIDAAFHSSQGRWWVLEHAAELGAKTDGPYLTIDLAVLDAVPPPATSPSRPAQQ